jgi:hypothetical protein
VISSSDLVTGAAALWKKTGREFTAEFDGVSMRPTIEPHQPLTVSCGRPAQVGDVVLALRGTLPVVHRVVWMGSDWLLTRGDARTVPDPPLAAGDVVGIVRDVPAYVPRRAQRLATGVAILAGALGRGAAHAAVRVMQAGSRARSGS